MKNNACVPNFKACAIDWLEVSYIYRFICICTCICIYMYIFVFFHNLLQNQEKKNSSGAIRDKIKSWSLYKAGGK